MSLNKPLLNFPIYREKEKGELSREKRDIQEIRSLQIPEKGGGGFSVKDDGKSPVMRQDESSGQDFYEGNKIEIKNPVSKSKDHNLEGKGVQRSVRSQVQDSALIHTHLKSKKNPKNRKNKDAQVGVNRNTEVFKSISHREKNGLKKMTSHGSGSIDLHQFCKLNIPCTNFGGNLDTLFYSISNIIQPAECNY